MTMGENEIAIVYLVAGLSSRFNGKIKQLANVGKNGETFIECSLNQAIKSGINKIIFVVGGVTERHFRNKFGDNYLGIPVYYALQSFDKKLRDNPWGTADALFSAKKFLDCPSIVCAGDDLYGENSFKILVEHLKKSNEEACIGYLMKNTLPKKGIVNRALFEINGNYVKRIGNAFPISRENILGKENAYSCMTLFGLHPHILNLIENKIKIFKEKNKLNRKSEFLLHETLSELIQERKIKMKIYPAKDKWIGITNPEDEEVAREFIKDNY